MLYLAPKACASTRTLLTKVAQKNTALFLLLVSIFLLLLVLVVGVSDLLVSGLFNHKFNWETNELRVLFDQVLEASLLQEFLLVLLELQDDLGSSGDRVA